MKTNLNEYFKNHSVVTNGVKRTERIVCADGFSLSVQVGYYNYCNPRKNDAEYYEKAEVGFPSEDPVFITEYAEDSERLTETVYPYTPVNLIEKLIDFHGGIKSSFNQFKRPVDLQVINILELGFDDSKEG